MRNSTAATKDRSICFTLRVLCTPVSGYVCTDTRDVCTVWIQTTLHNNPSHHRWNSECPIQKPSLPVVQQSTYSTYKNRNTAKVLIGVDHLERTGVVHLGCRYGGSTADRLWNAVVWSVVTVILAIPSWPTKDLTFRTSSLHDVTVNIPTFFKNENHGCPTTQSWATALQDRL